MQDTSNSNPESDVGKATPPPSRIPRNSVGGGDDDDEKENGGWPENAPGYILEDPIADLLYAEIDYAANVLGNLWLERQNYAVIQGQSGIGKSMLAIQAGVEAASGHDVFGLRVDRPLKVLVLQDEDSRNDRIRQAQCIKRIAATRAEELLVKRNLKIMSPRKRAHQGQALFEFLTGVFENFSFDLLILNPAFAFVDGSVNDSASVGDFLRSHLHEFLRAKNAAAIVIHHVPKPPKSGKGRASDTTMYAGHGSAEWANAPRASMTVNRTLVPWVFAFDIGKRGSYSGWDVDAEGYYIRYFTHTREGDMFWAPASERDIAAARMGVSRDDFASIFSGDVPLTFDNIQARFSHFGYNYTDDQLSELLAKFVEEGRLIEVEEGGETVWRPVKKAKGTTQEARREAAYATRIEEVYLAIKEAGTTGINVNGLRKRGFAFGNSVLDECLKRLTEAGRIAKRIDGRYVVAVPALQNNTHTHVYL